MEDIYIHNDLEFAKSEKKYQNNIDYNYNNFKSILQKNFYEEKYPNFPYDERQREENNTKHFHEIFAIDDQNNYIDNNQIIRNEENDINNPINKELNNTINNFSKENDNSNSNENNNEYNSGRWSNDEHQKFLQGILKYGNEWKKVQNIIKTRSSTQARSHAQKFFLRLKKELSLNKLANQDKLFDYIIKSCDKTENNLSLSNEQKEKLMTVIRSNIKTEETLNKSEKDYLDVSGKNNNIINIKNDSGSEDFAEEEDNLAYNKQTENNILAFNKKKSCDIGEKKRKVTFCSRKRKSSSDMSFNNNFTKIFNISKEINHKRSIDSSRSNNSFINKFESKDSLEKNNNNYVGNINNNNNFIQEQKININNNYINNQNINSNVNMKDYTIKKVYIQNNIYNIYNYNTNDIKEKSDIYNNSNIFISNKINNFQKANMRTVIFHTDKKTVTKVQKRNKSNEKNNEKNGQTYINNIQNFSMNKNANQENSNNKNCESDPFNLKFDNITSNQTKMDNGFYNYYVGEINEGNNTISEKTNNLFNDN